VYIKPTRAAALSLVDEKINFKLFKVRVNIWSRVRIDTQNAWETAKESERGSAENVFF